MAISRRFILQGLGAADPAAMFGAPRGRNPSPRA